MRPELHNAYAGPANGKYKNLLDLREWGFPGTAQAQYLFFLKLHGVLEGGCVRMNT